MNLDLLNQLKQKLSQEKELSSIWSFYMDNFADYKFVHGPFIIGGRIGGVIYFEEKQMGLVVVAELPPSQEVKYSRFSCQIMGKSRQSWLN